MNVNEFGKEQTRRMSALLSAIADAAVSLDAQNAVGLNTSAFMDYDEQDCFNATMIFAHVLFCYAIHHGYVDDSNATEIGYAIRDLCEKCGIDTYQEATVRKMLNNL